jgi:hypothetical protein
MKKVIITATILIVGVQAYKTHPLITVADVPVRPMAAYYLHDAVRLIIQKISNLVVAF